MHPSDAPTPRPRAVATAAPPGAVTLLSGSGRLASSATPPPAGGSQSLGPYTLTRLIATGGMGAVWEAIDTRLGRHVAVKVLRRDQAEADAEEVERFSREGLHAAKLHHPNIVALLDVGYDRGRRYLVMDLITGPTLGEALRERPLTWREKAELVETIARAVDYAHGQGVVHRDLKPANILLRRDPLPTRDWRKRASMSGSAPAAVGLGQPLVMDFGLAMDVGDDARLSHDGQSLGTPSYMPPEQAEGRLHEIGPRSDVYGLGAILYEALTGRAPFAGETPAKIMRAVVEDEPVAPGRVVAGVPRDLETICLRCLAKQPAKRYPSAAALADDLGAWRAGEPIAARPASWLERSAKRVRRNPAAWAVGAAASAVIVAGLVAVMLWQARARRDAEDRAHQLAQAVEQMRAEQQRRSAAEAERAQLERERDREWQLVFADDFASDDLAQRWDVASSGGSIAVRDGHLRLRDGQPQIAMPRGHFTGDLRFEFTARLNGMLSDISCFLASADDAAGWRGRVDGYLFQFGGRANTLTRLLREQDEAQRQREFVPLGADREYRVAAERIGAHLTYRVDDRVVLDWVDPQPLGDGERARVGIYGFASDMAVSDVRLYRLGEPRRGDVLDLVERHLERNQAIDARGIIDEVLESASDPTRVLRAKAARERLERLLAGERDLARVRVAVHAAWPNATVTAIDGDIAVQLGESGGGARSALAALHGLPIRRLSLLGSRVSSLVPLVGMPLVELDMSGCAIDDLAPLAGMPLRRLTAFGCGLTRLDALARMPLADLRIAFNLIDDLAPLAGLALHVLDIKGNRVRDLAPLVGMPLESLICADNPIASLAPVGRLIALGNFDCNGLALADLEALRGLHLTALTCSRNRLTSLAPLTGMPINMLACDENQISDLAPLSGMPLVEIQCGGNRIASLAPLAGAPLITVGAGGNRVRDLAPLRRRMLTRLSIPDNPELSDLAPLDASLLQTLDIADDPVRDLAPLARAPLESFDCSGTRVTSLASLRQARLVELRCGGAPLSDLAPLRGSRTLRRLWCDGIPATSLAPLAGVALDELSCMGVPAATVPLADPPPRLLFIEPRAAPAGLGGAWWNAHGADDVLHLTNLSAAALRADARLVGRRRLARLPGVWNHDAAEGLCRAYGGGLPSLADDAEAAALRAWCDAEGVWLARPPGAGVNAPAPCYYHQADGAWIASADQRHAARIRARTCVVAWDE